MYPHSLNSCSMPELPEHLWASCSLSNKHLQPGGHNEKRRGKKGQRDDNFLLGECRLKETVFCLAKGAQIYKINMNIQIFVYSPSRHRALCSSQSVLFCSHKDSWQQTQGAGKGVFSSCQGGGWKTPLWTYIKCGGSHPISCDRFRMNWWMVSSSLLLDVSPKLPKLPTSSVLSLQIT